MPLTIIIHLAGFVELVPRPVLRCCALPGSHFLFMFPIFPLQIEDNAPSLGLFRL